MATGNVLSAAEIEEFEERGFVMLRGAFPREAAAKVRDMLWERIGLSPDDPSGWTKPLVHLLENHEGPDADACFTPRLHAAFDQVMGPGRWEPHRVLGWWPISFPGHFAPPWQEPTKGWHVDGIQFHHHIHSRDQGLLPIFLFSDIAPGGGGTCARVGSHHVTARILQAAEPDGMDVHTLSVQVNEQAHGPVVEINGEAGDVALIHPFLSHARSENTGNAVRFICNPCFKLYEPMQLDRPDGEYSPVERAIRRAISTTAVA